MKLKHFKQYVKVISVCALLLVSGQAGLLAEAVAEDCPQGITAYWNLNETTDGTYTDAIGTFDGTCSGGCPNSLNGTVEGGQGFDGANTINVSADAAFNWSATQSFTIELWMSRSNTIAPSDPEVFIGREDGSMIWWIGINASGQAAALLQDAGGSSPGRLTGSKDLRSAPADATWHHLALVRDGAANRTTLYVDGQQADTDTHTFTSGFGSASAPLTIGSLLNDGHLTQGALDEVAVYGQALDAATIRRHYYVARDYCALYETPVKIMPMGNSITLGIWTGQTTPDLEDMVGYRLDLSEWLANNFYRFDFIGGEQNGQGIDANFDQEHAGFSGIMASELQEVLDSGSSTRYPDKAPGAYLVSYPTEFILLHVGTNDFTNDTSDVEAVLDEIDEHDKNITVVLAKIINRSTSTSGFNIDPVVGQFNDNLQTLADQRTAEGDKIIVVDMENGAGMTWNFDISSPYTTGDMYDDLHPNPSGYNKMAGVWFTALETVLPQAETPAIAQETPPTAVVNEAYTFTVAVSGLPAPTISLVNSPPAGMTIDASSGLIRWTPDTEGPQDVTVRAVNWAGQDERTLTITVSATPPVNTPPVAVEDNYSGITQGDTFSVTAADGVLSNDTDADSDPLTAVPVGSVSHGTLVLNADGSFTYTHDGSDNLADSFSYKANDGKDDSTPVSVSVSLVIKPDNEPPPLPSGGGGGGCFIQSFF